MDTSLLVNGLSQFIRLRPVQNQLNSLLLLRARALTKAGPKVESKQEETLLGNCDTYLRLLSSIGAGDDTGRDYVKKSSFLSLLSETKLGGHFGSLLRSFAGQDV